MVEKFPNHKFVIDHIAKPGIKDKRIDEWKSNMERIAMFQNVYCKLSGMLTEADWIGWNSRDFTPYLDVVFDSFGPDRLMYGSDWPVCKLAGSYEDTVNLVESYISEYADVEKQAIMGGNAMKFYFNA